MTPFADDVFTMLKDAMNCGNEQYINCVFEVFGMMGREKCEILSSKAIQELIVPALLRRIDDSGCSIESKMICYTTLGELTLTHLHSMKSFLPDIIEKFKLGFIGTGQLMSERVSVHLT